ncbi:MAG: GAF domain-containing protein [Acidobacteria bacterium]|nr:GAF domain-containing protein [Acidobacteriota bacterium]
MPGKKAPPVLAEAAGTLSEQLLTFLERLAVLLQPESGRLEVRFLKRLEEMGFEPRQRGALVYLTAGAAARVLGTGGGPSHFLEQVEYHGRRLAKLNLSPGDIVLALREFDTLLTPLLKRKIPEQFENFHWVREQLQFYVMLALNNSYYQVREEETQAFYEMFWAELEAEGLDNLLDRFLSILARFSRANAAHWYLADPKTGVMQRRATLDWESASGGTLFGPVRNAFPLDGRETLLRQPICFGLHRSDPSGNLAALMDPSWTNRFRSCWSIPLISGDRLAGLIQFGFSKPYEWLPRELELLTAAAERCLRAVEKAQLMVDLAERERQIRLLAERMMHVEEVERRRISRELHDQTGQDLLCIRLQMEMIEGQLPDSMRDCKERLSEAREMTERTILEIRRLIAALSPAVLEQLGLAAAIRQLINRYREMHPWRIKLQMGKMEPLPKQTEVILYRLLQECFHNISKHSQCQTVNLSLRTADGLLHLVVEDDGIGFDMQEAQQKTGSFGLAGIRERVALLGGTCDIFSRRRVKRAKGKQPTSSRATGSSHKSGTRIKVELPIPDEALLLGPHRQLEYSRRGIAETVGTTSAGK